MKLVRLALTWVSMKTGMKLKKVGSFDIAYNSNIYLHGDSNFIFTILRS